MPPIGLAIGGVDFSALAIILKEATAMAPAVAIRYGAFIQNVIDFLIVAWAVFWVVKAFNSVRRRAERTAPPPPSPTA